MDSFSHSLLQSLADALASLHPNVGASVAVRDAGDLLVERARAGALTALAHLPPLKDAGEGTRPAGSVPSPAWYTCGVELRGRDNRSLGLVRLVMSEDPPAALIAAAEALAAHASVALEQSCLHHELQRSFNQLFIVYEAGHLLNFCRTADDVLAHVTGILSRTLHFAHCSVLLLRDGLLTVGAHVGLDPGWAETARMPLEDTFAARVIEAGAVAQFEEAANLERVTLPMLDSEVVPHSLLCAPLTTRSGTLGALEVYRATSAPFLDDEMFVVSVLAVTMAAALENARLYEALQQREEQLTQYAAKLVNSQEDERRRISRDIHDGLGQMIVSAFQYLQAHDYSLPPNHPRDTLQHGLSVLQECIAETRRVMSDLRPSTLDDFGLVVALQQQLEQAAREAGWQCSFSLQGSMTRLAPEVETTVFRVVQEALNNARKHAQAARVEVTLTRTAAQLTVEVRDWGRGFVAGGVEARPERGERLGLMGMRERASLLGGSVEIASDPGAGTTVRIVLPVHDEPARMDYASA